MSTQSSADILAGMDKVLSVGVASRHSLFQLKYFVVGKEPTHQRKMWRCLEELKVRRDGLDSIREQIAEAGDAVKMTDVQAERLNLETQETISTGQYCRAEWKSVVLAEADLKRAKIDRTRAGILAGVERLGATYADQLAEATFFYQAFAELEKKEPLKPFDDFGSQLEYWNEKYSQLLNMKVLLQQPIDPELVHCALSLPEGSSVRSQVVSILDSQHKALMGNRASGLVGG